MADNLPRYWTQDFLDVFVKALHDDADFQKATKKFSNRFALRCTDTPDGKDVVATYTVDHGKVSVDMQEEEAPSSSIRNAPFDKKSLLARTTAPYGVWTKLDKGEMNVVGALTSPDYKLEGSKLKIMANIGVFNAMNAVAAKTPKSY